MGNTTSRTNKRQCDERRIKESDEYVKRLREGFERMSKKERDRQRYLAHKEQILERSKKWYLQHRDYMKKYREDHKEEFRLRRHSPEAKARRKEYLQKPEVKVRLKERAKQFRAKHKERLLLRDREKYKKDKHMRRRTQARNKIRNLPKAKHCEFCGSTENLVNHHMDYRQPEIYVTACPSCHAWIHKDFRPSYIHAIMEG